MNKHLFSLVCVTALATVASAEVVEKINGVLQQIDIKVNNDITYNNESVSNKSPLEANGNLTGEDASEKKRTLVIKNDGLVTVTGSNGNLIFKRDADLVLKKGGVLNVKNKSSDFSFEDVRMDNGVLKLTNSNFKVSDNFETKNNSQITLKADAANKANINAKNIKLDGSKMEVENYNLKSTYNFEMNDISGEIKNSSLNSDKDISIKNSTVNFNNSSLQAKNKILKHQAP